MEYIELPIDGYLMANRLLEGLVFSYKVEYDPEDILSRGLEIEKNIRFILQPFSEQARHFIETRCMNEHVLVKHMQEWMARDGFERGIDFFWDRLELLSTISSQSQEQRERFSNQAFKRQPFKM